MFRYVAFVWTPADSEQVHTAKRLASRLLARSQHWACALERPGASIYCIGAREGYMEAQTLRQDGGVILGSLFERVQDTRTTVAKRASLSASASARILASGGRELIDKYWGNYVALLFDDHRRIVRVVRGPSSALPCLRIVHENLQVYFSWMPDCVQLDVCRFSVDWEFIARHMVGKVLTTNRTGLLEVSQLRPGECMQTLDAQAVTHDYWNALEIARADSIEEPSVAVAELQRAVKTVVHTWASCHSNIMLYLSGGLDSSIVLACLKDAPTRPGVTCLNEYSPGADSDEREYARLMVQKAGCDLYIEQPRDSTVRMEGMLRANWSAIPQDTFRRVEVARLHSQLARKSGATAIFSGDGGDQLFFQNPARRVPADFVHRHGLRPELVRVAYYVAQLEGMSVWSVLKGAIYEGIVPGQYDRLADRLRYRRLVSMEARQILLNREAGQSWRPRTDGVPPGKLTHIDGVTGGVDYYDPLALEADPDLTAPLFSQPLIETVLRIPTYVLLVDGWDRGLARRAFATELPMEIAGRRSKGGIEEHTHQILRANLQFARELLLEGFMVQHRLLDAGKLAEALADHPSGVIRGMAEIGRYLETEAWLRMWAYGEQRMAA